MLASYINLSSATQRRGALEARVASLPESLWRLQRFEAISIDHPDCQCAHGLISAPEKACFLSHRQLLGEFLARGLHEPFMVWEDDVVVGRCTHKAVAEFIRTNDPQSWDIVYTDIIVPELLAMIELVRRGRILRNQSRVEVLDLKTMNYAGASAYLINPTALPRLVSLLGETASLDAPVDLVLRNLVHQGRLKAYALFPFVTTVSDASLYSQIQPDNTLGTDLAWTLFRQLTWMERDPEELYPLCNKLSQLHPDPESSVMGIITAALLSPQFKPK